MCLLSPPSETHSTYACHTDKEEAKQCICEAVHMQTSGKCHMPEHECQDSIASLRTGENPATPPMQLLSMHAAQNCIT